MKKIAKERGKFVMPENKRRNPSENSAYVGKWNADNPPGTPVRVTEDDGSITETKTDSPAWVLCGHTAVVGLEGRAGGYLLDRVLPL